VVHTLLLSSFQKKEVLIEMPQQIMENRNNRDGKIKELLKTIWGMYAFVTDTWKVLSQNIIHENQKKVCSGILEQTVECGCFIHSYASCDYS
jgi:hypothetical protein